MAFSITRPRAVVMAVVFTVFVSTLGTAQPVSADSGPARIHDFMWAVGQTESNGRYDARNRSSGAYGKYQIMPANWPSWAKRYVGDRSASKSACNQERVAFGKFKDLHRWLDRWPVVAHWWLTGRKATNPATWTSYARGYVNKVIDRMDQAPGTDARERVCGDTGGGRGGGEGRGEGRGKGDGDGRGKGDGEGRGKGDGEGRGKGDGDGIQPGDVRRTTGWLYFRAGPGMDFRARDVLRPGTRLVVRDTARSEAGGLWLKVKLADGRLGWTSVMYTRA